MRLQAQHATGEGSGMGMKTFLFFSVSHEANGTHSKTCSVRNESHSTLTAFPHLGWVSAGRKKHAGLTIKENDFELSF